MYRIFPHKKAAKYYESLDDKTAKRIKYINRDSDHLFKEKMNKECLTNHSSGRLIAAADFSVSFFKK